MKNKRIHFGCGWSKIELLTKFRDIHRSNPDATFQITTQGHSSHPNRINLYLRDGKSVSMNSNGIRLASAEHNSRFETIKYAEMMGVSYTLPNNTHHRLY